MSNIGGPWDVVATCNWEYNPTYEGATPTSPVRGNISRVISPVMSSY